MVEEIFKYKAPIAIIPRQSILKGELAKAEKSLKRCSKEESKKTHQIKIDQLKRELEAFYREKANAMQ